MKKIIFLSVILLVSCISGTFAQCPVAVAPSYPTGCTSQYFTSITASGVGVVSTISYTSSSCTGSFFDMFSSEGVTAPTGSTVDVSISRVTGFSAYAAIYVDWNNNGVYELSELAGTVASLASSTASIVYSFTVPLTGIVTNTNLHMRVFLGEPPSAGGPLSSISPPCSAKWGESVDYYINASCTNPVLSISPASPSVCLGNSVALTASGAGPTPTYNWAPPASLSASTGATVTASPTVITTYTVTGYGPGVCTATKTTTVNVTPGITAVVSAGGPTTFCRGDGVLLSETSGSGSRYQWYDGAAAIPGATNSTYFASPAASTTISVLITSAGGCTSTAGVIITIRATPTAVITPSGPTSVCSPSTVGLSANFSPGYTYRWFNSSGVIIGATLQNYTATSYDIYRVEITEPSTGCLDTSAAVTVAINPLPSTLIMATGPHTFCSYDSLILTVTSGAGYTYHWLDGATSIPGATNSTYIAKSVGTHDYRVRVTTGFGCTDVSAAGLLPVVVNPAPVSTITASGPVTFCTGGNVTLSTVSVPGNIYQWYYGVTKATTAPVAGGTTASFVAAATGYYYVKVTTPLGCTSGSSSTAVLVTAVKTPVLFSTTTPDICADSFIMLSTGFDPATTGIAYQWKLNGTDITGSDSSTHKATRAGKYTCVITVSGVCSTTTLPLTVKINPLPTPAITYIGGILRTETYYKSYQWYQNTKAIVGATTYKITPHVSADFSVIVVDTNTCVSKASVYPIDKLATNELSFGNTPVIYPNPATGVVHISYPVRTNIVVSSIDGQSLLKQNAANEIDISSLANSLYIISLFDKDGNPLLEQKLLKQ